MDLKKLLEKKEEHNKALSELNKEISEARKKLLEKETERKFLKLIKLINQKGIRYISCEAGVMEEKDRICVNFGDFNNDEDLTISSEELQYIFNQLKVLRDNDGD